MIGILLAGGAATRLQRLLNLPTRVPPPSPRPPNPAARIPTPRFRFPGFRHSCLVTFIRIKEDMEREKIAGAPMVGARDPKKKA